MNGKIEIAFGKGFVPIQADPRRAEWKVIRPTFEQALPDAEERFHEACRKPLGTEPLKGIVSPGDRVVVATSDGTRAVPNHLLIPWLLDALPVPAENVTVLLGTGTHRPNTPEEIERMFGKDVVKRVKIVNHDSYDEKENVMVGKSACGTDVWLNRTYVEADKKIVMGFIEPHFFAGFSGGPKGVAPGVAGIKTICRLHRSELIGDPNSTWGVLEENPLHREVREAVALCPPEFMVNVTLNGEKEISGFYLGHYLEAHKQGCDAVKASSMAPVDAPFPVVVTSNSGFPLDQNLYQAVKGISAAARIVKEGGTILVASECSDGVPDHGNFAELMREGTTPQDVLDSVYAKEPILDQWQAQTLATILQKTEVAVFSKMAREQIEACKLAVVEDLDGALQDRIDAVGTGARVAVLPDGPLTIPYVREG
ncbi:MAG: nickel-dependent lactate racemase [bacterium]|nr:nickel-dependent lactate racemase [bacterium]